MAHEWRPCTWRVNAQLEAWMHLQPAVQLLFVSQLARQLAEQLDCERGCCQPPVFEASVPLCSMPRPMFEKDLLPVASTEEESEKDTNRRLSFGTTTTGVPKEDDVLSESDEGEDINNVDDHPDGDGSAAQAPAQQDLPMTDFEDDSEAVQTSGVAQSSDQRTFVRPEFVKANFYPEILKHVLCYLPVNEVLKYNVRAVSRLFSDREVWMMHLFNLVDLDSLQQLSDVPTAEVWHPIEEFSSFCELLVQETDETLSLTKRLFSAPTQCFHADASEGFQGCFQVFFGPWIEKIGGKHITYLDLIEIKVLARSRNLRLKGR